MCIWISVFNVDITSSWFCFSGGQTLTQTPGIRSKGREEEGSREGRVTDFGVCDLHPEKLYKSCLEISLGVEWWGEKHKCVHWLSSTTGQRYIHGARDPTPYRPHSGVVHTWGQAQACPVKDRVKESPRVGRKLYLGEACWAQGKLEGDTTCGWWGREELEWRIRGGI